MAFAECRQSKYLSESVQCIMLVFNFLIM
jgi:hypothetical protein